VRDRLVTREAETAAKVGGVLDPHGGAAMVARAYNAGSVRRRHMRLRRVPGPAALLVVLASPAWSPATEPLPSVPRFAVEASPIGVRGDARPRQYIGVAGHRSAWLGTETGDHHLQPRHLHRARARVGTARRAGASRAARGGRLPAAPGRRELQDGAAVRLAGRDGRSVCLLGRGDEGRHPDSLAGDGRRLLSPRTRPRPAHARGDLRPRPHRGLGRADADDRKPPLRPDPLQHGRGLAVRDPASSPWASTSTGDRGRAIP
jgi:hypothetical protein